MGAEDSAKGSSDIEVALKADEMNTKPAEGENIVLSSGVVLKPVTLPPLVLMEAMTAVPAPKPPVYHDKRLGREIENPDDPDYKEALGFHRLRYATGMMNSMLIFGVEIVSIPEGLASIDSDEWVEKLSLAGIQVMPKSKSWRKLAWLKSVAVKSAEDNSLVMEKVGSKSGVAEADVDLAAKSFRSKEAAGRPSESKDQAE